MPIIKPVRGFSPQFGENCFIAENATIVGDVTCGADCSFWFNAVVRGDVTFDDPSTSFLNALINDPSTEGYSFEPQPD